MGWGLGWGSLSLTFLHQGSSPHPWPTRGCRVPKPHSLPVLSFGPKPQPPTSTPAGALTAQRYSKVPASPWLRSLQPQDLKKKKENVNMFEGKKMSARTCTKHTRCENRGEIFLQIGGFVAKLHRVSPLFVIWPRSVWMRPVLSRT